WSPTLLCARHCPRKPTRRPSITCSPRKLSISKGMTAMLTIKELVSDNVERLSLTWMAGADAGDRVVSQSGMFSADLVGHLNLIHPSRIQVFGKEELSYYNRFDT